jgi:hypothetical protein
MNHRGRTLVFQGDGAFVVDVADLAAPKGVTRKVVVGRQWVDVVEWLMAS